MNFAVLWVPDFALYALCRSEPGLVGRPLALTEGEGRRATILQASPEAHPVKPGYPVTLAMARCPGILLREKNAEAETQAQRLLIGTSFTLSPRVEATASGLCTVDLQGADPKQTEVALRLALAELEQAGIPARAGVGPTPLVAGYAAKQADPLLWVSDARKFLSLLPLAYAEPSALQAEIIGGWGLKTLGDFTALTKAQVGERLGSDGVALWERAAGEATRVLRTIEPARAFAAEWVYEPPIESLEPLLFKLRRYAECVALELRGAHQVAEALSLTLLLEDDKDYHRSFELPEPGAAVDSWIRVIQAHIDTVKTEARVRGVRLVARPTRPPQKQDGLFDTGLKDPELFWETLARVSAIVGKERVGTPRHLNTHRPDSFLIETPPDVVPPAEPLPLHPPTGGVLRRFRPAVPVQVALQENRPAGLQGGVSGPIHRLVGPWKLSGEWWHQGGWASETWHVELPGGAVYQLARTSEGWEIEGVID